jgi:hypothetical protein
MFLAAWRVVYYEHNNVGVIHGIVNITAFAGMSGSVFSRVRVRSPRKRTSLDFPPQTPQPG